jgi:hypothetical protein
MKDEAITLTGPEMYAAKAVALQIQLGKEKTRVANRRICSRDDLQINLEGQMGEVAVCRYLGLDYCPKIHLHGDGGVDHSYRGSSLQVKSTQTNYLLFPKQEQMTCDYAILCVPSRDKANLVFIRGWLTNREWFDVSRKKELIPGVISYGVSSGYLHPIDQLDEQITCNIITKN